MRSSARSRGFALRIFTAVLVFTSGLIINSPVAGAGPVPDEAADALTAERLARQSGKSIVISAETTETSQVKANPDGSRTLVSHTQPVRVKQNGAWAAVDLTLVRRPDGTIGPKVAPVAMAFTGGGSGSAQRGPTAKLVKDDAEVGFGWQADLPEARISGTTATYPDVLPGVDLEIKAGLTGFSESLVVKTPEAAKNPKLEKITFKSHSKNVKIGKDGTGLSVTDAAGKQIFGGDASRMWDSTGEGRLARMGVDLAADSITITPDQNFLTDPATKYPVRLDPDYYCTSCNKAHHAVVQSPPEWAGAHNYDVTSGQLGDLKAGYLNASSLGASTNGISRTYFQINTGAINGKYIHSATMHARVINSYSCSPSPTELWLTNWIDWNTTWNSQPGWNRNLSENNQRNNPTYCATDGGADFGATSAVVDAANGSWGVTTFMFKAKYEGDLNTSWRRFDLNPYLEVHYNSYPNQPSGLGIEGWGPNDGDALPCVIGANRPVVGTRTPRLRARLSDPDGGMLDAGFRLTVGPYNNYTWNGQDIHQSDVPSGSFAERPVPSGWITTDGLYGFHLWSGDYELSSWSGQCEFWVDTTAPNKPAVASTDYPVTGFGGSVGRTGNFTFSPNGNTGPNGTMDVASYGWSLNVDTVGNRVNVTDASGNLTVPITLTQSGTNTLYVQAFDKAGNPSATKANYVFNVADPAGPVAGWKLDETSGTTAADFTGGNRPLTLTGGATFGAGYAANAQVGNGTTAFSSTAAPVVDTSRAFSVSAWAKLDNTNGWYVVASQDGSRSSSFHLLYSQYYDRWVFSSATADSDDPQVVRAFSAAPPQVGVWTHLLGTYEPNSRKLSLYVNGKLEGTADATLWNAQGAFIVGALKWAGQRVDQFPGSIDHVQVWDRVLSASEAAAQNNMGVLRARYELDERTGTVTKDEVSGQNAAVSGGTTWAGTPVDPDDPNQVLTSQDKWLNLDGASGQVVGPRPVNLRTDRSYTVSAWVRSGFDGNPRAAVGMGDTTFSPFFLGYRPDWGGKWSFLSMRSATEGDGVFAVSDQVAQANTWTHLTATFDATSGTLSLYVNGVKQNSYVGTTGTGRTSFNATGDLFVGRAMWNGNPSDRWKGDVDDARIYSGVLSTSEIVHLRDTTKHL